jgi:predicted metal-dependent phosphoesterase TrpH
MGILDRSMIDLHTHSNVSDGTLTPAELLQAASDEGLSAIALTDHDTVAGLDEAQQAADRLGIRFVPGIELEVDWAPGVFHLLGLGLKRWHGPLKRRLERVRRFRLERNLKMVRLFQEAGMAISYRELREVSGHDTVGRPHFAQLLVEKGVVSTFQEAFDQLIGNGKPFYIRKRALGVGASCATVHAAGGLAILAHPRTLQLSLEELSRNLHRWKHEGLDGVEAYHANADSKEGHRLAALAEHHGLIVTAGSDFHAPDRAARLGRTCNGMIIDDRFLGPFTEESGGSN